MEITEEDLVGELEGFPIEVVKKMLERQVEQGNEENITVFQKNANADADRKGFLWHKTEEGSIFWDDIIIDRNFDKFFKKYPKRVMSEDINLCKILKGFSGIKLWTSIYGTSKLLDVKEDSIMLMNSNGTTFLLSKDGKYGFKEYDDNECIVFPSKEQRDWSKFENPIPIDTPMMVSCDGKVFILGYYKYKDGYKHYIYNNGHKSCDGDRGTAWKYVIPFDKFDPSDIEESLKFNIQK